jgi:hypothetical protein
MKIVVLIVAISLYKAIEQQFKSDHGIPAQHFFDLTPIN